MVPFVPASASVWQLPQVPFPTKSAFPRVALPLFAPMCPTAPQPAARTAIATTRVRNAGRS